jgi:hypothetical protein
MSIRRALSAACLVLAMIGVLPALASGAEIKMGGVQEKNAVITATGTIGYNMLGSWIQCTDHIEIRGNGSATTARVATLQLTNNTCEGAGLFEKCTLSEYDFTKEDGTTTSGATWDKPEWTVHVTGTSPNVFLKITNLKIHEFLTGAGCEISHLFFDFSASGLNLKPTTQTNITAATVSGLGIAEFETSGVGNESEFYSGNETTGRGSIPLTGASSGTYSLG